MEDPRRSSGESLRLRTLYASSFPTLSVHPILWHLPHPLDRLEAGTAEPIHQLSCVMLNVADVVDVQLRLRQGDPIESGRCIKRRGGKALADRRVNVIEYFYKIGRGADRLFDT